MQLNCMLRELKLLALIYETAFCLKRVYLVFYIRIFRDINHSAKKSYTHSLHFFLYLIISKITLSIYFLTK